MAGKTERVFDTVDPEAIKLLKNDPDAFFKKTRRQPFGFTVSDTQHKAQHAARRDGN